MMLQINTKLKLASLAIDPWVHEDTTKAQGKLNLFSGRIDLEGDVFQQKEPAESQKLYSELIRLQNVHSVGNTLIMQSDDEITSVSLNQSEY